MSAPVPPVTSAPVGPVPARRRGPLVWVLGCLGAGLACSCLGVVGLFGIGVLGSTSKTSTVGGPVANVVAPAAGNETPGTRETITPADLVGTWKTSGSAIAVDSYTGAYSPSGSVASADQYEVHADGTYREVFNGIANGHAVHEEKSGTWALQPSQVVFSPSGAPADAYWFRSYEIRADGGRTLTLLNARNPNDHGYDLYADRFTRDP